MEVDIGCQELMLHGMARDDTERTQWGHTMHLTACAAPGYASWKGTATARNGLTMNSVHGGYQQEQDTLHNIMHHVETVDQTAKAWC